MEFGQAKKHMAHFPFSRKPVPETTKMSKRTAEDEQLAGALKGGDRPDAMDVDEKPNNEMGEFEDEFEDEFDSEDEIIEAGVDGRPDEEREAEEAGMDLTPVTLPRGHG